MNQNKMTYEGMFLLGSSGEDFQVASEPISKALVRSEAEILSMKPWDDRRLAYPIRGHKRGLYVLTYFQSDPARIAEIEHECQLDERILRALILRSEHLTEGQINAETPATASARRSTQERRTKAAETASEEVNVPAEDDGTTDEDDNSAGEEAREESSADEEDDEPAADSDDETEA